MRLLLRDGAPQAGACLAALALGACATPQKPAAIPYDLSPRPAVRAAERPKPVEIVVAPQPLPLPDQLKPAPGPLIADPPEAADPRVRVAQANAEARIEPSRAAYLNAVQVYPFTEGALYQLYAAPDEVTDIALEAGEQLAGSGPVAAGDTVRWIIGDTESGAGADRRVHILVKPARAGLRTNLIINTDRRTYHLEMRSDRLTYMASVSWSYPQDQLIAFRARNQAAEATAPVAQVSALELENLRFRYRIEGDAAPWRPVRAFDDGTHVFIEFPAGVAQGDMPPLWIIGAEGGAELVNYRVRGDHMIVDRLFAAAELRLGGQHQQKVRIVRTGDGPAS